MQISAVKEIGWFDKSNRELNIVISAKDSIFIEEPKGIGPPYIMNSAALVEGIDYLLEFHFHALAAMKKNTDFMGMRDEIRELRQGILDSALAVRVRQLLSALDYDKLTDFQAKCVLLVEKELKKPTTL